MKVAIENEQAEQGPHGRIILPDGQLDLVYEMNAGAGISIPSIFHG